MNHFLEKTDIKLPDGSLQKVSYKSTENPYENCDFIHYGYMGFDHVEIWIEWIQIRRSLNFEKRKINEFYLSDVPLRGRIPLLILYQTILSSIRL